MAEQPKAGDVASVPYPFVRATYSETDVDESGPFAVERQTWKAGVAFEDWGEGDVRGMADAMGTMVLTVISVHKPGKFPTRVFFTRKFVAPDGHTFGKGKLHIVSLKKFTRLSRGYFHPFKLRKTVSA